MESRGTNMDQHAPGDKAIGLVLQASPYFFYGVGKKKTVWANSPAFPDRLVCQSDDVDTLLDCKYVYVRPLNLE